MGTGSIVDAVQNGSIMAGEQKPKPDNAARKRQERLAAELRRNLQLRKAQGRARRAGEPDLAEGLPAAREDGASMPTLGDDGEKPS